MRAFKNGREARMVYAGPTLAWPAPVREPVGATPGAGDLLLDADFGSASFTRYKNVHPEAMSPGVDYGVASDPAGSGAVVAWCDSWRGLTFSNASDRAELEGQYTVRPSGWGATDSRYAHLIRFFFPKKSMFPTTTGWSLLMEAHGPPFTGAASTSLQLGRTADGGALRLRQADDYSWLGEGVTLPVDQWVSILMVWQHDLMEKGGGSELLVNTTGSLAAGWQRIQGITPRNMVRHADTFALNGPGPGSYPASPRLGCYGSFKGRIYYSHHRLGRTPRAVLGAGWDGLVAEQPYAGITQETTQRQTS